MLGGSLAGLVDDRFSFHLVPSKEYSDEHDELARAAMEKVSNLLSDGLQSVRIEVETLQVEEVEVGDHIIPQVRFDDSYNNELVSQFFDNPKDSLAKREENLRESEVFVKFTRWYGVIFQFKSTRRLRRR
jgi:hypothetical protein